MILFGGLAGLQPALGQPPVLMFSPSSHDFGFKGLNETDFTTFRILNGGGCGCSTLHYTLTVSRDWVEVSPTSGSSDGESDTITVTIDTSGLSPGYQTCDVDIYSNGGNRTFIVMVTVLGHRNTPPTIPRITGPVSGKTDREYQYTFSASDPEGDDIYYWIQWGDSCPGVEWAGPYHSGEEMVVNKTWASQGDYIVSAKARDIYDAESEWGKIEVHMNMNTPTTSFFFNIHEIIKQRLPWLLRILEAMAG